MPRNDFRLSSKIAILHKIKRHPINTSYRRLAEITGVPKSNISCDIRQERQACTFERKRAGKDPDVEEVIYQRFSIICGKGVNIKVQILKAKSEELAKKWVLNDLKETDGWLLRWKERPNIKFKKAHGEKGSVDNESAMDRFTVLCCTNMSGTGKRKLLIIEKTARPRCFKGQRIQGYPKFLRNWLTSWDRNLKLKHRKILLVVDNSAAHPHLDNLQNIQLEFLPPDAPTHLL
ncbi:hypothetical protein RF11_13008 [Thelohanellus kitauei]|uniref:HTH CENPB-type domain-containing protein n=1 Tax=Thelohanellus kitauei TaxID=669202 RepID=A0A0C2MBB4_THEKT|nr:hypothetical protein RF11_13008 [Thelohanellus kitauei]